MRPRGMGLVGAMLLAGLLAGCGPTSHTSTHSPSTPVSHTTSTSTSSLPVSTTTPPVTTVAPHPVTTPATPATSATAPSSTTAPPHPTTTAPASTTTTGLPSQLDLSESNNDTVVHVAAGATIVVTLHSTYWGYS